MKPKHLLLLTASFLTLASCGNDADVKDPGRDLGALELSKEYPQAGEELFIKYTPEGDIEEVEGYYTYLVGSDQYPVDLKFEDSAKVWTSRIVLPDSALAVSFHLKTDGREETNKEKGYSIRLFDEEDQPLPGSGAALAGYYSRYGSQVGIASDSVLQWIEQDLENHADLHSEWDSFYAGLLSQDDKSKGDAYMKQRIAFYSEQENLSEEQYLTLSEFHEKTGNNAASDSLATVMKEKFPAGQLMWEEYYQKFRTAHSLEEKEVVFDEFDKTFTKADDKYNLRNYMLGDMARLLKGQGNTDRFMELAEQLPKTDRANMFNDLAWDAAESGKDLEKAAELSEKSLDLVEAARKDPKPDYWTQSQYDRNLTSLQRMYADTYATILFKQGNLEEAIEYQAMAAEFWDPEYKQRYVEFLIANEEYEKALETAEDYIESNNATATTKQMYKEAYAEAKGSTDGLDQRLAELEKIGYDKALGELREDMLDEEAPEFRLQDLEGKEVALSDLKDKTVILDFWATWCGPCKASFPGMQIAVDKYKNDENVVFLFVNTMEDGAAEARHRNVSQFIENNDYSFHVILDQAPEGSRSFGMASDYGVDGIPTKAVIGPDNRLKFFKVGYSGNNEQMVQELDMMIELAQG